MLNLSEHSKMPKKRGKIKFYASKVIYIDDDNSEPEEENEKEDEHPFEWKEKDDETYFYK